MLLLLLLLMMMKNTDSCDYSFRNGSPVTIHLKYTDLSSKELTWKHNEKLIFKRRNGKFIPGKAEDILDDGSLQLKGPMLKDEGTYKAEVFDSDGKSIKEQSFRLCMEKVSKPSVKFTCSAKDVTFTCTLTNTEGVNFKWSRNTKTLDRETKTTLTIDRKTLKASDTFTCSAASEVNEETSDVIQPTCKAVLNSGVPLLLFGFDFWTMVGILAGGGGLVLLLIITTLVCCCLSRRKSQMHFEEERELRLAPLTKTQHPFHPEGQTKHPFHPEGQTKHPSHTEGQKQRQRPPGGAPPGSTGPRPTARASSQAAPQPRAQARERPPQIPMDDDEEQPPPLPQPRKKGPHPPRQ
ncbi:T-cell surface antigen CD2 isoform X2 [Coregonus clupeaformis]|uniref:T-cell surface antigen CD2 isoform X2 n=1 Tax=Coregonus clupeaformis TaxID=59861 RepID=UPI001E1C9023|nr:T-cell surface antigen CD2 isoform X2 [Coregonus clupeaformis]